jgi:D-alanine-D-alanine ligase
MAKKLRVGILFGGRSGEHEVSLLSAASILKAIDRKKFDVVPIGITKDGHWLAAGDARGLLEGDGSGWRGGCGPAIPEATPGAKLLQEGIPTLLAPEPAEASYLAEQSGRKAGPAAANLDVVFPVLHGTFGEDGTIQGLFELAGVRLCRLGRAGFGGGHGQGRDEAAVRPGQTAHCEARDAAAGGVGEAAAQGHCSRWRRRSSIRCL